MHILAIETTDLSGSIALLDDDRPLWSRDLPTQPRSAATLAPAICEALTAAQWKPADIELVAVATGPGSFTGLRVGVTTAKLFAYAIGAQVMGINTFAAIAWQAPEDVSDLWTVLDAQRQQLFAGRFERDPNRSWQTSVATHIVGESQWLAELTTGCVVSGPGLAKLSASLPAGVSAVDKTLWRPRASTVGTLACKQYQGGQRDDFWSLTPYYFRPSAAEEKAAQKRA